MVTNISLRDYWKQYNNQTHTYIVVYCWIYNKRAKWQPLTSIQTPIRRSNEIDVASAHQSLLVRCVFASNSDEGMRLVFSLHAGTPERSSAPINKSLGGWSQEMRMAKFWTTTIDPLVRDAMIETYFFLYGQKGWLSFTLPIHTKLHIQRQVTSSKI